MGRYYAAGPRVSRVCNVCCIRLGGRCRRVALGVPLACRWRLLPTAGSPAFYVLVCPMRRPSFALPDRARLARYLFTVALAFAAAEACVHLHTPLPWMIGPLLVVALAGVSGAPVASFGPARNAAQLTIASALGLYFTPEVGALVAGLWWAIALSVAWALGLGALFGAWLQRLHGHRFPGLAPRQMRATTYFAGAIGAASEMTLLAERAGARTDLVAASHSLRVLIVTLVIPFAMQWSGLHGLDALPPAVREVRPEGLALLVALAGAGGWLAARLKRANPWFLGALLVSMALTLSGIGLSAVPQPMSNAAQLLIGISLGVRFNRSFLHTAPRWLATVAFGTLVLVALCAGFALMLSCLVKIPAATLVLGTSPGGIAEMAITAKVLQLGVPVVTAFQVCRLIAVLLLVEPVFRRLYPQPGGPKPGPAVSASSASTMQNATEDRGVD